MAGKFHGQRSLVGCTVHGVTKSSTRLSNWAHKYIKYYLWKLCHINYIYVFLTKKALSHDNNSKGWGVLTTTWQEGREIKEVGQSCQMWTRKSPDLEWRQISPFRDQSCTTISCYCPEICTQERGYIEGKNIFPSQPWKKFLEDCLKDEGQTCNI